MEFGIIMIASYDIRILCCSYEHSMSYCMFRTEISRPQDSQTMDTN